MNAVPFGATQDPREQRFRTSSGIDLALDRYGSGSRRLVVLSHGIFGHRHLDEIRALASHLSDRFDVIAFDCRGHGDSTGRFTFGRHEWNDLAELVAAVRGPYQAVAALGFSFGAFHTCLAAATTGCFDAVMLVSGPKDFRVLDHNPFGPGFLASIGPMRRRRRRRTRLALELAVGRRTMPIDCVAQIRVPLHIVHGDQDWVVHHRHAEELHKKADGAELTILEGGLHAEYLLAQMPGRMFELIDGWLDRALGPEPSQELASSS